jgi:ABC-2 type transport system permease protein
VVVGGNGGHRRAHHCPLASIRGQQQFEDLARDLPDAVRGLIGAQEGIAFTSPPGYLSSRLFSSLFPLLLIIFGIGLGARAVGGSEEDGTIELVLAHPVTRARVLAERYVAVVVLMVGLTAVGLVSLVVLAPTVDLLEGVPLERIVGAGIALVSLGLLHASLTFAVGCIFGRRGIAVAVASAVAVAGYVFQGLIAATDAAKPARFVSPWHWYLDHNLLVEAPGPQATLLPLTLVVVFVVFGFWSFLHRDLRIP